MSHEKRNILFKRLYGYALLTIFIVLLVYAVVKIFGNNSIDDRYTPSRRVSLQESDEIPVIGVDDKSSSDVQLRVAVAPVVSPEKSLKLYNDLVHYLGTALNRKGILIQRQSYAETNELIRQGGCEIAFVCTYAFVQGQRDFGLEILAVPQIKGRITYQSFIIVPHNSQANTLMDLRDKRFGSSDLLSNSGWLFPAVWLIRRSEDPKEFFSKHVLTGSHDRSVTAVATEYVDGAAVDSLVYDQITKEDSSLLTKTKIIMKSPDFGMPPVVVHPRLSTELKKNILKVLTAMHTTQEGKKSLTKVGFDRFVVPDNKSYDSVREAADIWESYR